VIVAVPEQQTVVASGIGVPEYTTVLTSYRWWCSACRISAPVARASHADLALRQGGQHLADAQCHTVGQLALFNHLWSRPS
jgi:hypothetical protein